MAGPDDAIMRLDIAGRVVFANAAAARLLGADAPAGVVGAEVTRVLRERGEGTAALALQSATDAVHGRITADAAFTVYDALGAPRAQWHVTPHGHGVSVVVRPAAERGRVDALGAVPNATAPSAPDAPEHGAAERHTSDALADLARELAGAPGHMDEALEQFALRAQTLLGGDGACVVVLEGDDARIVAANGTLGMLAGQRTELHEPPSPLHEAITARQVVVSPLAGAAVPTHEHALPAGAARRHVLVAPLTVGEQVVAALCVVTGAQGFAARDRALAERLAEHGALAVRNDRLYRSAERGARDARLLADAAQVLTPHVTPASLYPALAGVVTEALGASGFSAVLADPATGAVEPLHHDGPGARVVEALSESAFWESAGGRVVREGRPLFLDGTLADAPSDIDRMIAEQLRGTTTRALALLPLVAEQTRGLLALHFAESHTFDEPERRLLTDFAAQVALAVRNATLFVARERERDRAAAAAEVARVALDAASLDAGATAILSALERLVPSDGKALSVLRDANRDANRDAGAYVECVAACGTVAFLLGMRSPGSARPARRASDARVRPVVVDDLRTVLTPEKCPEAQGRPEIEASAVIVPLVARGRTLGDLAVTTPLGKPLGAAARDALAQLAAPVALALDSLLLAEERRRRLVEERQMTEQLRQAEKMAALGELVAGVAHEINNPLTGISAFAELLLDDVLTDEQRESVRLIKREADRVVGVVRDLLVFSRKTEPAYSALDLNDLVERTLRLRGYALRGAGIDVRLALDPTLPVVYGDEAKLQQVLLNVLLNAEHAMRETSHRRLEAATRRAGDRVILAIADSGTGIAADVLPRVFDPFFTTKPAGEGTGLGLSVSYGIMQAHGGELRLESAPGIGTTVEIVLPHQPSAEPELFAFGEGA